MVTVFKTEPATPALLLLSTCPDDVPMLSTFCASSRVLSRLATAVAERPGACMLSMGRGAGGVGRGVTLGRGVEGVVVVLAMEASV